MSLLAYLAAAFLFLLAGLVLSFSASLGVAPLALIAWGLVAFALAHVLP